MNFTSEYKFIAPKKIETVYLTTTFGRASVPQRLINQSLYQEILLLKTFNDIGGKVLKPKLISLRPQKKNEADFW